MAGPTFQTPTLTQPSTKDGPLDPPKMAEEQGDKSMATRLNAESTEHTHEGGRGEREQVSSRSASPSAPFSVASQQSKSPASPQSPTFTSLPQYPPASPDRGTKSREGGRGFFQNFKASRSGTKIHNPEHSVRPVHSDQVASEETPKAPHRTKSTPELRETTSPETVPDLPRLDHEGSQVSLNSGVSGHAIPRRPIGGSNGNSRSSTMQSMWDSQPHASGLESAETKKNSRLFSTFMRRNHHNRSEDTNRPLNSNNRSRSRPSEASQGGKPPSRDQSATRSSDVEDGMERPGSKSNMKGDGTGARLFREFRQQAGHAAKEIGKSRGRFFRHRNSSNTAPPPDFTNYEVKIINQPLAQQTRITRIARRLEDSKDKTEFWMPALPWRCIDYLNFNGAEVEGLYRVPGSEREVRLWKARFDQEYDIDLFQEEELYDVNTIGSLFKSWLRDLPEDILPTSTQDELSGRYSGEQKAPEEVKEVLSQLPPWNYYLLFAITCHLSLLHAYEEKNKMSFNNLFVCFAPALRLNGDCFRWLVGDWRACWIGCATEKEALEEEYRILDFGGPDVMPEPNPPFLHEPHSGAGSRKASSASSIDATPRAEDFRSSPLPPAQGQFAPPPQPPPPPQPTNSKQPGTPVSSAVAVPPNGQQGVSSASGGGGGGSKPQGRRPKGTSPHSREGSRAEQGGKASPQVLQGQPLPPPRHEKLNLNVNAAQQQQQQQQPPPPKQQAQVQAQTQPRLGNSKLPELNLPQPISPTFTKHRSSGI